VLSKQDIKQRRNATVSQSVSPRVCVVCAPPMRCMCAVTASDSRMSDGVRLQNLCSYIYIVSIEFFRRVRATIGFPLTLHKGTCLSSEKRSEESHNLHSGEPSRIRSKNIGTSLGKSSVQLKSYYARAHKTRCWLFADWLAHGAPSKLDGAPRAFPSRERPDKKNCSAVRPSDRARDRAPTPDN